MTESDTLIAGVDELYISNIALVELMQDVLSKNTTFRFRAVGWSMVPFIHDGDVITIAPINKVPLEVGDVVAFIQPESGKLIVHRIVREGKNKFLVNGDNQSRIGGDVIQFEDILGRVTNIERAGHSVRLGIGPEKRLIALFSREQLLQPVLALTKIFVRPFRRLL